MVINSRKGDNFDDFYRNSLYFFPLEQSCDPRLLDLKSEIRKDVLSRKLKDVDNDVLHSKKFKKIYELYLISQTILTENLIWITILARN